MAGLPSAPWTDIDASRVAAGAPDSEDLLTDIVVDLNFLKQIVSGSTFSIGYHAARRPYANRTQIDIATSAFSDVIDSAVVGAHGLDTGPVTPDSWYALYIIFDPGSGLIAGMASLSFTAPVLPAGYTAFRRVDFAYFSSVLGGWLDFATVDDWHECKGGPGVGADGALVESGGNEFGGFGAGFHDTSSNYGPALVTGPAFVPDVTMTPPIETEIQLDGEIGDSGGASYAFQLAVRPTGASWSVPQGRVCINQNSYGAPSAQGQTRFIQPATRDLDIYRSFYPFGGEWRIFVIGFKIPTL